MPRLADRRKPVEARHVSDPETGHCRSQRWVESLALPPAMANMPSSVDDPLRAPKRVYSGITNRGSEANIYLLHSNGPARGSTVFGAQGPGQLKRPRVWTTGMRGCQSVSKRCGCVEPLLNPVVVNPWANTSLHRYRWKCPGPIASWHCRCLNLLGLYDLRSARARCGARSCWRSGSPAGSYDFLHAERNYGSAGTAAIRRGRIWQARQICVRPSQI